MSDEQKIRVAHAAISQCLEEMLKLFTVPMKLTFIARDPNNPACELMVSDDDFHGIRETLSRLEGRQKLPSADRMFQ